MTQAELLFKIYVLIAQSGVCPETKPYEWVKTLLYLHSKGWLWSVVDKDNNVEMAAAMYRVPSLDKKYTDVLPEKEEGNILYIPFFVSVSKDTKKAQKVFKKYLKRSVDIETIAFFERGDDTKLKMFNRKKGRKHGRKEITGVTSDTNVSD
jgi:hypothetical protein